MNNEPERKVIPRLLTIFSIIQLTFIVFIFYIAFSSATLVTTVKQEDNELIYVVTENGEEVFVQVHPSLSCTQGFESNSLTINCIKKEK